MIGPVGGWHVLRYPIKRQVNVKTKNHIIPKKKVALETWLAELRRSTPVSGMGVALLALQIAELEHRCAAIRQRMEQEAKAQTRAEAKKRPLRSAA